LSGGIGGVWFRWEKARNRQSGSPRIAQMKEVLIGEVVMSLTFVKLLFVKGSEL
jgi:hypothetical protein